MRAEVINRFKDRKTGVIHEAGEIIEVTEKRFKEILRVGEYVKAAPEPRKKKTEEE